MSEKFSNHTSEIVNARPVGNGLLAVTVRCCGDPTTDSVLTLHELQRDNTEIDADIQTHKDRVEKLHGDSLRAFDHVSRLIKK